MPEVKASKTKTKTGKKKKNGKLLSPKTKKVNKPKAKPSKKLPASRRNEIWETLSAEDHSEKPAVTKKNKKKKGKRNSVSERSNVPKSRRNEIWESLSDDLSETPSSPADVMVELEDWSDNDEEDLKGPATPQISRLSSMSRIDMSGSLHSSEDWDRLMNDDSDDEDDSLMDEDSIAGEDHHDTNNSRLPVAPFAADVSERSAYDDGKKPPAEMSLKELKAELQSYGIPPQNFLEKIEMVKAVKEARLTHAPHNRSRRSQRNQADDTTRSRSVSVVSNVSNNVTSRSRRTAVSSRFVKQQNVIYTSSNGTAEVATILKVHLDDELVPFYDILLKDSGKEKQTDDGHLSPIANNNNSNRQQSGHIPDSIAFGLDDEEEHVTDFEGDYSLRSQYSALEGDYDDSGYAELSHHSTPNRKSLSSSLRSPGLNLDNSVRSRRSASSVPNNSRRQRNSMESPHQNKLRVRTTPSSRRGSNVSPTRQPRRSAGNLSPTRPPRRSSTNTSPLRPASCRRRDSTESYHTRPASMRASNSSPTRPPSCRRRDSTESYHARPASMRVSPTRTSPTRPPSCRRRDSTESYHAPPSFKRASTTGGRPTSSVRSASPLPPKRPVSARHHSAPLSPVRKHKPTPSSGNVSPKRPTTNRKADLSPKRPKSSVRVSPHRASDAPAPYGHSLRLLNIKKRMSS